MEWNLRNHVSGKLVKGHYESNKRHGTFSWYLPASDKNLSYWCKVDYDRGEKISDQYDITYE